MSETRGAGGSEALFSFELIVDFVQMDKGGGNELAVAVRLLDFPTLLIHQPERTRPGSSREERDRPGQFIFNRGKCCFFRMHPDSLNAQLSNAPLHAMVLDVKEDVPRLVGTSLISLAEVMDRLRQDLVHRGASTASAHGRRGLVGVRSLTGVQVGFMSLSYKLLSLGGSLLSHGTDGRTKAYEEQCVEEEKTPKESPDGCGNTTEVTARTKEEEKKTVQVSEDCQDEDLSVFCPPHLYYNNSAEERRRNEADYKALKLDSEVLTFEDSGDEMEDSNRLSGMGQKWRHDAESSSKKKHQEMSEVAPSVLRDALRRLPLLNALLVELSQLNIQNPDQTSTPRKRETPQKTRGDVSPELEDVHQPRYSSTPKPRSESQGLKPAQTHTKTCSRSPRRTLVYGTTKTFNLRLKQVSPVLMRRRECVDLIHNKTTTNVKKERVKSGKKATKSSQRKLNQSLNLNENIETMVQRMSAESGPHETITIKYAGPSKRTDPGPDRRSSDKPSPSERTLPFISVPSVDTDGIANDNGHHSNSHQSRSESDGFRRPGSGSSRTRSPESSISASSQGHDDGDVDGDVGADYADDFNSLEPSDTVSPDAVSSPESWRAKTPRPPLTRPDSDSEGVQRRPALPVPIKGSPQRVLRTTQTIRTQNQALSLSSEDGDGHASVSPHSGRRTQSSRDEQSSGPWSFRSRSRRSDSVEHSGPGGRGSPESVSSFDAQEAEDELGSLDFRKGYRHISELVANKLPGYTM
uniref:Si:ch1073-266p11.2 n=2 Tax=Sphaeramia orbicularis TaxID=375764 RepID=A0A672ZWJ9_9TELE